jgi:hypothetical protein
MPFQGLLCGPATIVSYFPVPESDTDCVLVCALSVIFSVAERKFFELGVKVTLTVQLAPWANELPQVLFDTAKSEALLPDSATLLMVRGPVPWLLRVTDLGALVVWLV